MRDLVLVNCDIYTGDTVLTDHSIVIRDGFIVQLSEGGSSDASDGEVVDLGGQSVSPGFIDLQVNGGGDVLFNDEPTTDGLRSILRGHRTLGTTDVLPTFITGPMDRMREANNAVRELRAAEPGLLGIHYEGPLINESKLGVHDASFAVRTPSEPLASIFTVADCGSVMVTLAPELSPTGFIRELVSSGVRVAAGHTAASAEQIRTAIDEGLSCGTHVWNAMTPLTSRDPGAVGALLSDRRVWCDFVADGHHVAFTTLAVSINAVSPRKAMLVTDAMSPVGGAASGYTLGPYHVTVENGRCITPDGTLAGSALDLATAIRNVIQQIGVPKDEALRMATLYPAEFLGISDRRGRIAPGYPAHLAVFDNEIHVSGVVYGGEYTRTP